ncbi:DUF4097 family beta strand repeat-containing protein [Cryptosporangium aurantiacum]|uniref:DUF4097 family beta strand repeat-containing protein n=1 Tax=Cryptosporangium aurantiacum TaxID=134849 RepID=UPI0015BE5FA2|nr:DUF4097 family beta strand repeat-containing protein [Cryptosporangium aurantiacum]
MRGSSLVRSRATAVIAAVAALTTLTACDSGTRTATESYEATETVTTLEVDSGGGDIEVAPAADGTLRITETMRYTGDKPSPRHAVDGGTLTLESGCDDVSGNCGVNYRIEVPAAVAAQLSSGGGDVTLTAPIVALAARTDGGRLAADGVEASAVRATTDGGAIRLRCTTVPGRVDLDSGGGAVTVQLPSGAYAVDASTDGGKASVRVVESSSSHHRVTVRSRGGNVTVEPA